MQRRRQRQPAETLGLRHLHGRLQNPVRKVRGDGLEKRQRALRPDRRHERRLGLLRLRGQRHGLRRGLRAAGRRDRRQNLGERRPEIHRRTGFGQRLSLFDFGRGRQSLRRRQRGRERRPDGQNLEGRRGGLRLFGEPRRVAGQSRGRLGERRLRRRQPSKRTRARRPSVSTAARSTRRATPAHRPSSGRTAACSTR